MKTYKLEYDLTSELDMKVIAETCLDPKRVKHLYVEDRTTGEFWMQDRKCECGSHHFRTVNFDRVQCMQCSRQLAVQ